MGGAKRPHVDDDELAALKVALIERLAIHLEKDSAAITESLPTSGTLPTVLELGLSSAAGAALKGCAAVDLSRRFRPTRSWFRCHRRRWVLRKLEAELTTFELLKTPLDELLLLILKAQKEDLGASLPGMATVLPPVTDAGSR